MTFDPRIDAYIAGAATFARPILERLRAAVHSRSDAIDETIKWGMPAFTYRGRPVAHMAAFKAHSVFGLARGAVAEAERSDTAMGHFGRLTTIDDLPDAATLEALIDKAIAVAAAGPQPRKTLQPPKPAPDTPHDLAVALAATPEAQAIFDGFPPGARREYIEWIVDAKRPETRAKRITEASGWIAEGKKRHWKYEGC